MLVEVTSARLTATECAIQMPQYLLNGRARQMEVDGYTVSINELLHHALSEHPSTDGKQVEFVGPQRKYAERCIGLILLPFS